ncbi:hypothetical protein TARUN_6616 [Trichoderma arundinaceum]|uniref:Uncharacterized protein n=1 Tax=Trichoderma arundinaceum TaxID=490622 RepID=A0A395NI20_TRIAR|nr:hypothetical protein TARUN_6616 [Trichoderma arundinaceum]
MKTPTIAILAALRGLQAVVAQQIASTPVWVDATTCNPWAKSNGFPAAAGSGGLFTTALDILNNITDANLYRMYNPRNQSPETLPANVLAWERYRLNSTFDAFFGNNTDTKAYESGVWHVAYQLWGIQAQWGPVNSDPYIFVVCDDAPYLSKHSNGKLGYTDPYYHSKTELDSDAIVNDGVITACATNGQSSYTAANRDNWSLNVILCTKNMNLPLGFTSKGPATFASGTTLDVAGSSSSHGFAASHAIRNTIEAVSNADSLKYFAIALGSDNLYWGSGVGQTSQQEYARLQKTAAGKGVITAFGLSNIAVPARGTTWASGWAPPNILDIQSPNLEAIPRA